MNKLTLTLLAVMLQACASAGFTNEDAGLSVLASDVSVPANGRVIYTIDRQPRMGADADRWAAGNGVNRSVLSWFGFDAGDRQPVGNAKNQIEK